MNRLVGLNKRRKKPDFGKEIKAMANIYDKDILPKVKLPRPYKPRPNARHKHNMEERKIEKDIIKYLRRKGFKCGKINPEAGSWNSGIADVQCFTPNAMWYIEVKTTRGRQQDNQIEFEEICKKTGINYLVARSVEDVKEIK